MKVLIVAVAAVAAAVTLGAGTSHADDQSFIDRLHATQFVMPSTEGSYVRFGHMVCDKLHAGAQPSDLYGMFSLNQGPNVVDAAQHELCPDTLR
ncbi:hypothetical protein MNAB215_5839 [Mycobacterium numidiamassiliense]|uniref:DUF732 domain-containing protein n=1 Tax=Mycobacterium numidiamassiliense TaxID=1841861 RepID=A0A2U3PIM7_9MYCO|nr:DUF732 domain-containing protein [Mycobacterium numidiamassiliense]SPM43613.1 hypothetical protein MNAB215_5839 [Mycobacterium numidiamassiliense]